MFTTNAEFNELSTVIEQDTTITTKNITKTKNVYNSHG